MGFGKAIITISEGEIVDLIRERCDQMKIYCDPETLRYGLKRISELNEVREKLLNGENVMEKPSLTLRDSPSAESDIL